MIQNHTEYGIRIADGVIVGPIDTYDEAVALVIYEKWAGTPGYDEPTIVERSVMTMRSAWDAVDSATAAAEQVV